ncbi:MAG: glycosyl hydrolase family 8 [Patescibacteria group bacterium]|nr:glycosyl hydrolase family 8 [Patescibacteria group bacterium]
MIFETIKELIIRHKVSLSLTTLGALLISFFFLSLFTEKRPVPPKSEIRSELKDFYRSSLLPDYQKGYYVDSDGSGNSETQSYALLQSYLVGDKETFDRVWKWTKENLQRKEDHLFAWKYYYPLKKKIEIADRGSAADADTDIAFALVRAGEDWMNPEYIKEALLIINGIWNAETTEFLGKRYPLAGNWANLEQYLVLNPSYFSPAAYRTFAKYDIDHDWQSLVSDQYEILEKISFGKFREKSSLFLPPNWVVLDKKTNDFSKYTGKKDSFDYSYDAFRTFWRVALDQALYPNAQAMAFLTKAKMFEEKWKKGYQICSIYKFSGENYSCEMDVAALAGPLSIFSITNVNLANELIKKYYLTFDNKLNLPRYSPFFHKSWYWFGLALWAGFK